MPKPPNDKELARLWAELEAEARHCKVVWGMGFPCISLTLLRKHWQKATGWMPPEGK